MTNVFHSIGALFAMSFRSVPFQSLGGRMGQPNVIKEFKTFESRSARASQSQSCGRISQC